MVLKASDGEILLGKEVAHTIVYESDGADWLAWSHKQPTYTAVLTSGVYLTFLPFPEEPDFYKFVIMLLL